MSSFLQVRVLMWRQYRNVRLHLVQSTRSNFMNTCSYFNAEPEQFKIELGSYSIGCFDATVEE